MTERLLVLSILIVVIGIPAGGPSLIGLLGTLVQVRHCELNSLRRGESHLRIHRQHFRHIESIAQVGS